MKNINYLLIFFFLLSCGSLEDAGKVLKNEKIRTTDEFLVKKRNPLMLPPNFEEIPEPGSMTKKEEEENEKIKKILNMEKNNESLKSDKSSSAESSILNRIRK
tara:strand:+ start:1216 stop:1524 length:309 start_codon:yes stop_codon:yes gene_type:complete